MSKKPESLFVTCSCGSECISIEKWGSDPEYYVSVWERGMYFNGKLPFKSRLRYIWQVLRHGKPFGDQLVFTYREFDEISSFIRRTNSEPEKWVE